jgi:gas vesicle protein
VNISKDTIKRLINSSQSKINAVKLSPDEIQLDRAKSIKNIHRDIKQRLRSNKEETVVIVDQ